MLRCPVASGQEPSTQEPTSTEVRKKIREEIYKTFVQAPLSTYAKAYISTLSHAVQNTRADVSIVSLTFLFTNWEFAASIPPGKDFLKDTSCFSKRSGTFECKLKVTFKHKDKEHIIELPGMAGKIQTTRKVTWEKKKKPHTSRIIQVIEQTINETP